MELFIQSVSIVSPGLDGWAQAQAVLSGKIAYKPLPLPTFVPNNLPANERRRITPTICIALQAATEASESADCEVENMASVFVSTCGDLAITDRICTALTLPGRPVSPIDFHNSVHNAPASYWAIGTKSRTPSTSLSAGPDGFATGLLDAATQVCFDPCPVLLVVYDLPPPPTLRWPEGPRTAFACSLILSSHRTSGSLGRLQIETVDQRPEDRIDNIAIEQLRIENPAARCLPLMSLLATQTAGSVVFGYNDGDSLLVTYTP